MNLYLALPGKIFGHSNPTTVTLLISIHTFYKNTLMYSVTGLTFSVAETLLISNFAYYMEHIISNKPIFQHFLRIITNEKIPQESLVLNYNHFAYFSSIFLISLPPFRLYFRNCTFHWTIKVVWVRENVRVGGRGVRTVRPVLVLGLLWVLHWSGILWDFVGQKGK